MVPQAFVCKYSWEVGKMEHVAIFMAWPYANGPLHLGHVAGNCLPADIQYRYERSRGRSVIMCSGSDEHGTPITVTAEQENVNPQEIVNRYHEINTKALDDLGCSWNNNIDRRGIEYGGALYNRTTDPRHKDLVQEYFTELYESGYLKQQTMQQYCSISADGKTKFLPDRYVEGQCPICNADGARGDQCDECGSTYESIELINPRSKMDPEAKIEIRDTDHFFFQLNEFQEQLEKHSSKKQKIWKPNVKAMTKNWLNMDLRPRAVTRDMEWGINLPLSDNKWDSKRIYVWFEAVQGYLTCSQIWAENYANSDDWKKWWIKDSEGIEPKHIYFMGKDNIPFHTVIWPAIIMGLNSARSGQKPSSDISIGDLVLESNVPAMEYLMLQGGQFSKSRKHAVWLPSFLENHDPDTLRYFLSINMPEGHDTDFRWEEYVDKVNNELIGTYGNFVHRVMTLTHRLQSIDGDNPLSKYLNTKNNEEVELKIEKFLEDAITSMEKQRFKEALRSIMNVSQLGNGLLQHSEPWKYLKADESVEKSQSLSTLAFCWQLCRGLAITMRPFLPFQSDKLWLMLGEHENIDDILYEDAFDFSSELAWNNSKPMPLFTRLEIENILEREMSIAGTGAENIETNTEEVNYIDFEDFMKVEMKTGKVIAIDDHPNADKLYVVTIEDGPDTTRTVCAGLKGIYDKEQLLGKQVVFVANLKPRKLRGIMSEGMILAADDGEGKVSVLTLDSEMPNGSQVR
ncbi:MAG: methionine--tRNA ligase [Candidatus Thalassarchaeum sp.]|jgi:methionyl-tRNA synthetase|nr:methionine--tRNA ligase [Candidatus Thalassarchaeum sp.]